MPDLDLDALEALLKRASPGEWSWTEDRDGYPLELDAEGVGILRPGITVDPTDGRLTAHITNDSGSAEASHPDFALIVALRNAAPSLLAAARERDALRKRAEEAERLATVAGVCELGAHNPNVASYCREWEARVEEAEAAEAVERRNHQDDLDFIARSTGHSYSTTAAQPERAIEIVGAINAIAEARDAATARAEKAERERYEAVARAERAEKALRDATTAERDRCAAPEGEVERLRREFYEAARERLRAYEAWQFSTEYDTGHLKTRFEEACDDEKVAYDALLAAEGAEKSPGDGA